MKIIFMGSSEFSRIILQYLVENKADIICVYTRVPKKAGRGHKLAKTVVHEYAEKLGIEIKYPVRLRGQESEFEDFKSFKCDVAIVASYGLIIPANYLTIPKFGFINVHPSSLPLYRGAAPIQRTIQNGDLETASCIMQMDSGLDTGDVLKRSKVDISDQPSYPELHDKMAMLGAKDLLEVLGNLPNISPVKQDEQYATYAHKISKEEGVILSSDRLEEVERKYRAFDPWPGLYFKIAGEEIKLCQAKFDFVDTSELKSGSIVWGKRDFKIALSGGFIVPTILQRSGRAKIDVSAFVNGFANKVIQIS